MLMRVDAHGTKRILSRRNLLLTPLAIAGCKREITHQRVDPALAPLIPPDTTTLYGIRLDNLRKTAAWDKLFPANGPTALDQLQKHSGLDIRNGMYEVVYPVGGKHSVALIRGKFVDGGITNAGLEPEIKIEGAQKFPYKGFMLVGKEEEAITFLNTSVAILGRASGIRAIIDNRELKNAVPKPLLALVETLPPESNVWIATIKPTIPEGGIAGVRSLPLSLTTAKAYLDLRFGASFRAEAQGNTIEDAKKLLDGLKGILSILRVTLKPNQKELLATLDSIQLFTEGATVKLQVEIPLDLLKGGIESLGFLNQNRA